MGTGLVVPKKKNGAGSLVPTTPKRKRVCKLYEKECTSSVEDFLKENNFKRRGLTTSEARTNLTKYGKNEMRQKKPKQWYNYLLESLFSTFNLILLGIVVVLFYTDVILSEPPNYANIIVILILITASTLLEFVEVFRSNKAAEKLKSLVSAKTDVIRNGKETKIPSSEVTVGDAVVLNAGDLIPADLRLIETKDLYVNQSSLTGESDSVKKLAESEQKGKIEDITDLDTICFMGTNVISGSAKGIVLKVGDGTYFGKIADTITDEKPKTAFQKGIDSVSKLLIRFMTVLIPITFIANAAKHGTITAFTFAVAIAIGITPLLLPVILSSSLAKGATRMSKKKTIVKRLDSIQSFGAMNILCTDKTGTLTEDKIVLEKYLNIKGEEDTRVLKHAFLNSYFQSGLEGNIDQAVIKRVNLKYFNFQCAKFQNTRFIQCNFSENNFKNISGVGLSFELCSIHKMTMSSIQSAQENVCMSDCRISNCSISGVKELVSQHCYIDGITFYVATGEVICLKDCVIRNLVIISKNNSTQTKLILTDCSFLNQISLAKMRGKVVIYGKGIKKFNDKLFKQDAQARIEGIQNVY